jgi:imidazoleglycerol phosphate synthase glutamine amidotransferase subunit HisH
MSGDVRSVTLLDYGAGNVRSIRNAITKLGWSIIDVTEPDDILNAERLIFPGVGSFAAAMDNLTQKGVSGPRPVLAAPPVSTCSADIRSSSLRPRLL